MLGAGQYNPYQQGGIQPGMYPGMMGPTFQPTFPQWNVPSGPAINFDGKLGELSPGQKSGLMGMQGFGMVAGGIFQGLNTWLASESMNHQFGIANKYYDTQQNIASYQQEAALRQLEIQDNALFVQQRMHRDQMRHEETMKELESKTQSRLARITEEGRTERAKVLSVSDAFSRRGWDYGMPFSLS